MMDALELGAWLRLVATPGIGPGAARKLLAAFGSPQAVFEAQFVHLKQVVSAAQAQELLAEPERATTLLANTQAWLEGAEESGVFRAVLTLGDTLYPKSLLRIDDPPLLLHVHARQGFWELGSSLLSETPNAIAVVGSRNASTQGAIHARSFSQQLAQTGWTIVSGLALGIDAAAHQGAVDAGAQAAGTIAVVGTGIDRTYPRGNAQLAREVLRCGAIVSEFVLGTPVLAHNFPRRNRIIAGLSRGTLVVEAAIKSGSLITARLALEQGKDVFAVPGSIHSVHAKGCHALIKQGAGLVESAQDILDTSGFGVKLMYGRDATSKLIAENPIKTLTSGPDESENDFQRPIWLAQMGYDPISLDELLARTGETAPNLQAQLLELELIGRVERLAGNRFQQVALA